MLAHRRHLPRRRPRASPRRTAAPPPGLPPRAWSVRGRTPGRRPAARGPPTGTPPGPPPGPGSSGWRSGRAGPAPPAQLLLHTGCLSKRQFFREKKKSRKTTTKFAIFRLKKSRKLRIWTNQLSDYFCCIESCATLKQTRKGKQSQFCGKKKKSQNRQCEQINKLYLPSVTLSRNPALDIAPSDWKVTVILVYQVKEAFCC